MSTFLPELVDGDLILLVEDQEKTREWIGVLLTTAFPAARLLSCARLDDAFDTLAKLRDGGEEGRLWLAVIDINLPDGSGLEIVKEVATGWPEAMAVVATIYNDDTHLMDAIAMGAKGYLLKGDEPDVFIGCLRRLTNGEPAMSPSIAHRILAYFREMAEARTAESLDLRHQQALTPRETEVLAYLGRGFTVGETAGKLGLSSQTVATYVRTIYSKLSISNRAQAVLEARRRGLN